MWLMSIAKYQFCPPYAEFMMRIVREGVKNDAKFRDWLKGPGDPDATAPGKALHASLRQYA